MVYINIADKTIGQIVDEILSLKFIKTTLDLSKNRLAIRSKAELTIMFIAIQESGIKGLDLSQNNLWALGASLGQIVSFLKDSEVTHLKLTNNDLAKQYSPKSDSALVDMFSALKNSKVKYLSMEDNGFESRSADDLEKFIGAIPQNIVSINFSCSELKKMDESQRQIIRQRFPVAINPMYEKLGFKTLKNLSLNTQDSFFGKEPLVASKEDIKTVESSPAKKP